MSSSRQFLSFLIAGEVFAAPLLHVREIVEFERPRPVPGAPSALLGVINLRGQIVPVVDLAGKLGVRSAPVTRKACIVVVEVTWSDESVRLGLAVEEVCDVVELAESHIEPPPMFATIVRLEFLLGVGKVGDQVLLLLDLDRTLAQHELLAAAEMSLGAGESQGASSGQAVAS